MSFDLRHIFNIEVAAIATIVLSVALIFCVLGLSTYFLVSPRAGRFNKHLTFLRETYRLARAD